MSLRTYYERQAATCRRLADQAMTWEVAQRLLSAANGYEQRARDCAVLDGAHSPTIAAETDQSATKRS